MSITFFYRNKKVGYSIGRVFQTITPEISKNVIIKELYVPSHRARPLDILRNMYFVFKHRNKAGINHITGDIHYCVIPLIGCKTVLTVHDLVDIKRGIIIEKIIKWFFWIYLPVRLSSKVTCISNHTEISLKKFVKSNKTIVIHNPVDSQFQFSPKEFSKLQPRILHIGCGWNKNLERVIDGLSKINCHLRIIGKVTEKQKEQLQKSGICFSIAQNLTNAQILDEYKNCDIVSFPSIYEGFGMPIIEAQQTGRVILTSNIEPLVEIGGTGAYYIDPLSTKSIKDGFLKLILDQTIREKLISNGLENVKRFSKEKIIKDYSKLYNQLENNLFISI